MLKPKSAIYRLPRTSTPLTDNTLLMGANGNETNAISLEEVKEYLGSEDTANAVPLSQKGQPNGVATLESNGKIPSSQLPEISGGGGTGFIFENLEDHFLVSDRPSAVDYFYNGNPPTLIGNNIVGTLETNDQQSGFISWFEIADKTSYKIRLLGYTGIQFIETQKKVDFANVGVEPNYNPILAAGNGSPISITIANGYISANTEFGNFYKSSTYAEEEWLEITRNGTEVIWTIDGVELMRLPQDLGKKWVNILVGSLNNSTSKLQYDLTNTIAYRQLDLDISRLSDMVIYRSNSALEILGHRIAVGDYVQLYDNKTKVITYPQFSPVYDFNLSSPDNQIINPVQIINTNPEFILTQGEDDKGNIFFPYQENIFNNFLDLPSETLENFYVSDQQGFTPELRIKENFDPEGLLNEVVAEFKINKDYITTFNKYYTRLGTASSASFYFYAGADKNKNYLRLKIERYPTQITSWHVCGEDGVENFLYETADVDNVKISLKQGIYLRQKDPNNISSVLVDNIYAYINYLNFTDNSDTITVRAVYKISEEARTGAPSTFSPPIRGIGFSQPLIKNYTNFTPVEIDYKTGVSTLKLDKEKSFSFYFIDADSLSEFWSKITESQSDLKGIVLDIYYNPSNQLYSFTMNGLGGTVNKSGSFSLNPNEELIVGLNKSSTSLQLSIKGNSLTSNGLAKNKLFITDASMLFKVGILPEKNIRYDFSKIDKTPIINFDSIQDRDRVRFIGGETAFNGKAIKEGDIVEFFDQKSKLLITPTISIPEETRVDLVVTGNDGSLVDDVRAWYDPIVKRICVTGNIWFTGYGNTVILKISKPDFLQTKTIRMLRIGCSSLGNITTYAGSVLICQHYPSEFQISVPYAGDTYLQGNIVIPDSTMAFIL